MRISSKLHATNKSRARWLGSFQLKKTSQNQKFSSFLLLPSNRLNQKTCRYLRVIAALLETGRERRGITKTMLKLFTFARQLYILDIKLVMSINGASKINFSLFRWWCHWHCRYSFVLVSFGTIYVFIVVFFP